jgi:hypothetical protein
LRERGGYGVYSGPVVQRDVLVGVAAHSSTAQVARLSTSAVGRQTRSEAGGIVV